jgi:hypothetical protein
MRSSTALPLSDAAFLERLAEPLEVIVSNVHKGVRREHRHRIVVRHTRNFKSYGIAAFKGKIDGDTSHLQGLHNSFAMPFDLIDDDRLWKAGYFFIRHTSYCWRQSRQIADAMCR